MEDLIRANALLISEDETDMDDVSEIGDEEETESIDEEGGGDMDMSNWEN